jgi:hypothetical protein
MSSGSTNFMRLHVVGGESAQTVPQERRRKPRYRPISERRGGRK